MHKPILSAIIILACMIALSVAGPSNVVQLTDSNFDKTVLQSEGVWIVSFYAPWCGHCKRLHPEYEKAADSLGSVVNLGAINCDENQALAQRFGIRGFPTIKVFPAGKENKRKVEDYQSAREARAIVSFALNQLPNHALAIDDEPSQKKFFDLNMPKAILFTNKPSTPALFKSLALEFKSLAKFGVVPSADKDKFKALTQKYNVESFPKIVFIPSGSADSNEFEHYNGELKKKQLVEFFAAKLSTNKAEPEKQKTEEQKVESQPPKVRTVTPVQVTKANLKDVCSKICVLGFVNNDNNDVTNHSHWATLYSLANRYKGDGILQFGWIDISNAPTVVETLGKHMNQLNNQHSDITASDVVVLRLNKQKYTVAEGTFETASSVLDRIVSGDLSFHKLPQSVNTESVASILFSGPQAETKANTSQINDEL